jgi:hypothetical protein
MKQAASFHNFKVALLLPGITVITSATDFYPIQAIKLARSTKAPSLLGSARGAEPAASTREGKP